ncbi:uncharacterized protein PHACADRAFT_182667 [Phanerochaete carnosa HHB-10118-sp]|uniref:Uncharacterized protein n=1 Tax=Phanerochaete carnosa (strain HHB-10118-sp) TaxID=650164 RepID=K5WG99_PHACS|nr:uncharacterized protein PHACADRAFT_207144 [Phanerochaete carnosa HHB-10118-sp]XP_007393632.1 uncharacterized protein PHACADRAFT_182667 [Phanerochaete carnosa HHB-10118-sp]EKM58310.1 hypothetical protein PHACADRAFT_207144 [Phanerochaete carnosa HHB-10118-sp]EKM58313.1 hypothetical protein PHACADRAFT_182667 [Phanerochaete carnosa HHB-10118-sp]
MTVYSSHFFPTSPAGSGNSNVQYSHTKATVGLGLGLPSDVLTTSVHVHAGVGLGIFIDSWFLDDDTQSEEPASMSPVMPSPPLLAPRRSPRKPPTESPGSEYAPMRTPSPSVRGCVSDVDGTFAPLMAAAPFSGGGATGGAATGVGLGIDVPGLGVSEVASSCRESGRAGATLVGLGLSLPCLDEAELVTTIEPQSTHAAGVAVDLSFLEDDADSSSSSSEVEGSLPSPWSHPASPVLVSCVIETVHPKPARAYGGVGFALDGEIDGEYQSDPDGDSVHHGSPCEEPTLGFDSPFWATYASALQGAY